MKWKVGASMLSPEGVTDTVDKFLLDLLLGTNDIITQKEALDTLLFRTSSFDWKHVISMSLVEEYINKLLDTIYRYNSAAIVFERAFHETQKGGKGVRRFYPLLVDQLKYRARQINENIFKAFSVVYPGKQFMIYYYDLMSKKRVRKDNALTAVEQLLPKGMYIEVYTLFTIEDFENKSRDNDFIEEMKKRDRDFDLTEDKLLNYIKSQNDNWLDEIIINYGEGKGGEEMITSIEKLSILRAAPLFKMVSAEILFPLAQHAKEAHYGDKEYIVEQAGAIDSLFIIYEGEVDILVEDKIAATLSEKEAVGEIELFRDSPAIASVRAKETKKGKGVSCLSIRKKDFDEVFTSNIELARAIIISLGDRLTKMNERVQELEKRG